MRVTNVGCVAHIRWSTETRSDGIKVWLSRACACKHWVKVSSQIEIVTLEENNELQSPRRKHEVEYKASSGKERPRVGSSRRDLTR